MWPFSAIAGKKGAVYNEVRLEYERILNLG